MNVHTNLCQQHNRRVNQEFFMKNLKYEETEPINQSTLKFVQCKFFRDLHF